MTGISDDACVCLVADVMGDRKIGVSEALFHLQGVADKR